MAASSIQTSPQSDPLIKMSQDNQIALAAMIADEVKLSEQDAERLRSRWDKIYRNYRSEPQRTSYPWPNASDIFVPLTWQSMTRILPRQTDIITRQQPIIEVVPLRDDAFDAAPRVERLLEYQHWQQVELPRKARSAFWWADLFGTSVVKIWWRQERALRRRWEVVPASPEEQMVYQQLTGRELGGRELPFEEEILAYNGPDIEAIPIWDFYVPSDCNSIDAARWVAHQVYRTWWDLKGMDDKGFYYPGAMDRIKDAHNPHQMREQQQAKFSYVTGRQPNSTGRRAEDREYNIIEWWGRYRIPDSDIKEEVSIVAWVDRDTKTLLRAIEHPYWHSKKPFVSMSYFKDERDFYGTGLGEALFQMNRAMNAFFNAAIDNWTAVNAPTYFYERGAGWNPMSKPRIPGAAIQVQNIQRIKEIIQSARLEEPFGLMEWVNRFTQDLTSLTPVMMGQQPSPKPTLGGMKILRTESNIFFRYVISQFGAAIAEIAMQELQLNQQYLPQETEILALGKPRRGERPLAETFNRKDTQYEYQFRCSAVDTQPDIADEQETAMMLMNTAMTLKQAGEPINLYPLEEKWLRAYRVQEREQVLGPPDTVCIPKAQLEQMMQSINAAQGAAAPQPPQGGGGPPVDPGAQPQNTGAAPRITGASPPEGGLRPGAAMGMAPTGMEMNDVPA